MALLEIRHTWDGQPIPIAEQSELQLFRQHQGLWINIKSPYYQDPPPPVPTGMCDGLWDYEVVELFIAHGDTYTELELGPDGHYLLLQLTGIRQIQQKRRPLVPTWSYEEKSWFCNVLIPWGWVAPEPWTFNAYAIHGVGDKRRYLAAYPVPGKEPDFHRLDCFRRLEI